MGEASVFAFAKSGLEELVVEAMIIMNMTLKMGLEKHYYTFFFFFSQGKTSLVLYFLIMTVSISMKEDIIGLKKFFKALLSTH